MKNLESKRENEKIIVGEMIEIYCRKQHGNQELCPVCKELYQYSINRIDRCPFMETKTFCSNCKVHCYQKEYRERIREVMRFSGPRMAFIHPILSIRHLITTQKEKRRLENET